MFKKYIYAMFIFALLVCATDAANAIDEIWREAELANSVPAPMQILSDDTASGGQYIANPTQGGQSNTNPPTRGIATYNIKIKEGGVYRMYVRVLCTVAGDDDDSCYIRIQGATLNIAVGTGDWIADNNIDYQIANSTNWFWKQVGHYATFPGNEMIEFTMSPGNYTVEITYREDGLKIDGFLLTNEENVDTANLPDEIPLDDVPIATRPNPANNGTEVSIDTGLSWVPGIYADTHNVYFGTDVNEVTDATLSEHPGVDVFEALDVNALDISRLAYGTDYFWRVDEVNLPSKPGTYPGTVWTFTTEPEGIPLDPETIVDVTAYTPIVVSDEQEPNMTCNGSGLDENDMHSTAINTMWLGYSEDPEDPVWIQYEFDKIYKFFELHVWNYNEIFPSQDYGAKDVNVTYSMDGETWEALDSLIEFQKAPGDDTCVANTFVDMNGAVAKYIKFTFLSSWTEYVYTGGLSEVRFLVIPTRATTPDPEDEADNIELDQLLSWEPGRDVAVNKVYIGSDANSVRDGIADVIEETADPNLQISLNLSTTYYWKVDEVNDAEDYTTWDGPVWSFSTVDSIIVEDFEVGYDSADANAVWMTWSDGYYEEDNGAEIGKDLSAPGLSDISQNGDYSAPVTYDNTPASVTYSEVSANSDDLPIATSDWSIGSPKTLTIWFRGDVNNVIGDEKLYCKIGGQTAYYEGSIDVLAIDLWRQWDIDLDALGVNLSNIPEIAIGIEKVTTGGSGVFYIDNIRLTGIDPLVAAPEIMIQGEDYVTKSGVMDVNNVLAGALGGQYMGAPDGIGNALNPPVNDANTATYTITIPEDGVYRMDFRVYGYGGSNSFWLQIPEITDPNLITTVDGETVNLTDGWINTNNMNGAANWHWDRVLCADNNNQDLEFNLAAGTYTLKVGLREDGFMLDALVISKVRN